MRDFYDIYILLSLYENKIDDTVFKEAFDATCKKRGTVNMMQNAPAIIANINEDDTLQKLWTAYQKKYSYAGKIQYADIMQWVKVCSTSLHNSVYLKKNSSCPCGWELFSVVANNAITHSMCIFCTFLLAVALT